MSLETCRQWWDAWGHWGRLAVVLWVVITLGICIRSAVQPHRQSVYPVWKLAGNDWRTGHDLYEEGAGKHPVRFGYRYSPLVAACYTLLDLVPERAGNVLWRLVNLAAFLAAMHMWMNHALPSPLPRARQGLAYLLVLPIALGSLNNGQVNLLLIALLLACSTAILHQRWNLAALFAAVAVLLKIYPLAFVLLVGMLYPRRFLPRFVLALVMLSLLPFVLQHPEYVLRQYGLWWERVRHNDEYRRFWPIMAGYRDIWQLLRVWQVPISLRTYMGLQVLGGACCAAATAVAAWRLGRGRMVFAVIVTLATSWMVLLGPAPESCTYILIGPSMVWWLVATDPREQPLVHYTSVHAYGLMLLVVVTGTSHLGIELYHIPGLQPLSAFLFLAAFNSALLLQCCRSPRSEATLPTAAERPVRPLAA